MKQLHMKDGINVAGQPSPTNSRSGSPRTFGTGEVDFRPILAAARGKVQYYHQEHDGGTITDADTSLTNLKGVGTAVVPAILGLPTDFAATAAGVQSSKAVTIKNTGDAPPAITGRQHRQQHERDVPAARQRLGESPPELLDRLHHRASAPWRRTPPARCRSASGPPARLPLGRALVVPSNADNATEAVLLTGSSNNDAAGRRRRRRAVDALADPLGRDAASAPSCRPPPAPTRRPRPHASSARPATRRSRSPTRARTRPATWSTARSRCRSRCRSAAPTPPTRTPRTPPLSETAGASTTLLTYSGPTAGADTRHGRVPPGDRRQRGAARRQLQQDADVHAVHHHAVVP